jgi:cold shock CspA family protein
MCQTVVLGTPRSVWVHFSAIEGNGYRALKPGARVRAEVTPAHQDD